MAKSIYKRLEPALSIRFQHWIHKQPSGLLPMPTASQFHNSWRLICYKEKRTPGCRYKLSCTRKGNGFPSHQSSIGCISFSESAFRPVSLLAGERAGHLNCLFLLMICSFLNFIHQDFAVFWAIKSWAGVLSMQQVMMSHRLYRINIGLTSSYQS